MIKDLKIDYNIKNKHFNSNSFFLKSQAVSVQTLVKRTFFTSEKSLETQEFLAMIDTAAAVIIGFMEDNLLEKGFNTINHLDFHQWLKKHGASKTTLDSGFVLMHYDKIMSYTNGDIHKPDMEAGTALQLYLPLYFCCKGAFYWDQEAGLGDAIFAPIYEVLKRRGVVFKFFHKVEELVLNSNSKFVEEIRMTKQVRLLTEEYNPLIKVKGLPSWPNEPKYKEIINQEAYLLQQHNIDLESFWTNWTRVYEESFKHPIPEVILRRGKDFDIIVYGIPVGSLASLCPELLDKSPSLRAANEHIGRIPSFNLQFWGTTDLEYDPKKSFNFRILDARQRKSYLTFYNDDILKSEDWKAQGLEPNHLLYIVYMPDISHFEIPPGNNTLFPKEMTEEIKGLYMQTLPEVLRSMGSNSFQDGVFNWTVLADPENRAGVERFDSQYVRLNFSPSDHYTQVLANTSQYRITTDGAGFDNIYFTGDWIQNGINYGTIEGAITSGLLTSKAISGYPEIIFFEQFIPKENRQN